jgi:hypothetical protein
MAYELTLAYCANPECGERITIDNWPMGGTVQGYPFCPDCFRVEEEREVYRKQLIEERYA